MAKKSRCGDARPGVGLRVRVARSVSVMDVVQFGSGTHTMEHCVSVDQSLIWGRLRIEDSRSIIIFPIWKHPTIPALMRFLIEQTSNVHFDAADSELAK